MRERLDCAVLGFGDMANWNGKKSGIYARGRLYLHHVEQPCSAQDNIQVLAQMATHLQRFDVCMLGVGQENLAWVRQVLLAARSQLRTPVIGLVRNLKAPAIGDLYNLGMADFVREPFCVEEVRIRTERLLDLPRPVPGSVYADMALANPGTVHDKRMNYRSADGAHSIDVRVAMSDVVGDANGKVSDPDAAQQAGNRALEAFARASASQCAVSGESFGIAKGRVVQCFERTYIHASLARSSGNIAQAARGAKKAQAGLLGTDAQA